MESVAASTDEDSQRQLNALYGQDVTSAVRIATSAQVIGTLGAALGVGKAAGKVVKVGTAAVREGVKKVKPVVTKTAQGSEPPRVEQERHVPVGDESFGNGGMEHPIKPPEKYEATVDATAPKTPAAEKTVVDSTGFDQGKPAVEMTSEVKLSWIQGANPLAYRPVSPDPNSFLPNDAFARAGQARADLYQAWKADNAHAYTSVEEQVVGYQNLVKGESPWPDGFTPVNNTIPQGAKIRMAMSPGQPLTSPGGFGTLDAIPNESYVRNELAVKHGWKNEIGGVVEYEVTRPLPVREGPVGPQVDLGVNRYLPGRGSQVNFNIPRTDSRMDYLKIIGFTPF